MRNQECSVENIHKNLQLTEQYKKKHKFNLNVALMLKAIISSLFYSVLCFCHLSASALTGHFVTCENWAKLESANRGTCPRSSWQISLHEKQKEDALTSQIDVFFLLLYLSVDTHGSGVYVGLELWRMYCVEWNTLKASPARKSRDDRRPATGRSRKPVHAAGKRDGKC